MILYYFKDFYMRINNQTYLFFCTTICDVRFFEVNRRQLFSFFDRLEKKADDYLAETRHWLKGKRITIHTNEIIITDDNNHYIRLIDKTVSIAKAVFFFIPGIVIKAFVWTFDFSYVQRRNKLIFENEKKIDDFKEKFDIKPPINPNPPILPVNQIKDYPDLLVEALGNEKFSKLHFSPLPDAWMILFENAKKEVADFLEDPDIETTDAHFMLLCQTANVNIEKQLTSLMENDSIQKIKTPEGCGFILRVKDNLSHQEQALVIAKVKGKWMVITRHLSEGLWLFLNDLRFYDQAPKVLDYLKRLFNGEPCGNFPKKLNDHIKINYLKAKASDTFIEGPRLCPDEKTPVIQLWPTHI